MHNAIAEAGDLAPFDLWVALREVFGQLPGCLANDLDRAFQGHSRHPVPLKITLGIASHDLARELGVLQHVPEADPWIIRAHRSERLCAGPCRQNDG